MIQAICSNSLCAKPFVFKGGKSHWNRHPEHFCSRGCKNVTHGLAGTQRHKIWEGAKKRAKENGVLFRLTVAAAVQEGFTAILCERESEYVADIRRRLGGKVDPLAHIPAALLAEYEARKLLVVSGLFN